MSPGNLSDDQTQVFMITLAIRLPAVYLLYRYENKIELLLWLSARKQINEFTKKKNLKIKQLL